MEKITKHIGGKLRERRETKGYSQSDLALNLGVTKAYISGIENGRRNLSIKVLKRILDVLGVDVFEFFNLNLNGSFQYSDYQEEYIKQILKNNEGWYLEKSGFWGKRFLEECQDTFSAERSHKELSIIARYLKNKRGKILDAPCGYGRISNKLSQKGYNVTGLDLNGFFIDIAQKDAHSQRLKTEFIHADIFDFTADEAYDVVINIYTSIGYFETEEKNKRFLSKLCSFVKPGGILLVETVNPIGVLGNYKPIEKNVTKSGSVRIYERFFDVRTSTNIEKTTLYDANGAMQDKSLHCVRLYYPHELIMLCEKSGLKIVDVLDSEGGRGGFLSSTRMWLAFQKPN